MTYRGVEVYLFASLTSALDAGKFSPSHPSRFTSKERALDAYWIGCVGPRADLDEMVKRTISSFCRESSPDHPARSPALYHWTNPDPQGRFVPVLNEAPCHEDALGKWRYWVVSWSASQPGRFIPREKAPRTRWIGGWVGLRSGLDTVAEKKFCTYRELNPAHTVRSSVIVLTELARLLVR
jgi:hypothetical protein